MGASWKGKGLQRHWRRNGRQWWTDLAEKSKRNKNKIKSKHKEKQIMKIIIIKIIN
jgi:hypothetical protein